MTCDYRIENWLHRQGVDADYRTGVDLVSFDTHASLANQARMGDTLNQERVQIMGIAVLDGAELPPLVAWERADHKLVLIDGNHRYGALKEAGRTQHDVYVVATSDERMIQILTRCANSIEGVGLTRQAMIGQAIFMVENLGVTMKEAAARMSLPYGTLRDRIAVDRVGRRLMSENAPQGRLSPAMYARLDSIQNNRVMVLAENLAHEAKLTNDEVSDMVKEVNSRRSEAEQYAVVETWRDRPDVREKIARSRRGKEHPQRTNRQRLFGGLISLERLLTPEQTLVMLQCNGHEDVNRLRSLWSTIKPRMEALLCETSDVRSA